KDLAPAIAHDLAGNIGAAMRRPKHRAKAAALVAVRVILIGDLRIGLGFFHATTRRIDLRAPKILAGVTWPIGFKPTMRRPSPKPKQRYCKASHRFEYLSFLGRSSPSSSRTK